VGIFKLLLFIAMIYGIYRVAANFAPDKYHAFIKVIIGVCIVSLLVVGAHMSRNAPVDIMLDGKIPLRIPKAYLREFINWSGGNQEFVSIEAVLPDMQPRIRGNKDLKENIVYIDLMFGNASGIFRAHAIEHYNQVKPYLEPPENGISKVSELGELRSTLVFDHDDSYVTLTDDGRLVKISCEKKSHSKCQNWTNFNPYISGSYSVDRKFIPARWKEVDDKVLRLVQSFLLPMKGEGGAVMTEITITGSAPSGDGARRTQEP
jgi:hypothetical protein